MSTQKLLKKFEKIYNETYNNILRYVVCKCNNLNDVDDIIQETYLELYRILKHEREILNYESYLITIAKNKIIKYVNLNKKINTISIFQENNQKEVTIDFDSRYRYRVRFYFKR